MPGKRVSVKIEQVVDCGVDLQKSLCLLDRFETIVEPNGVLNDRRRESVAFIDVFHLGMLPEERSTCQYH